MINFNKELCKKKCNEIYVFCEVMLFIKAKEGLLLFKQFFEIELISLRICILAYLNTPLRLTSIQENSDSSYGNKLKCCCVYFCYSDKIDSAV